MFTLAEIKSAPADQRDALRGAFERWLGQHWNTIEGGGYGDVDQLFADLSAAWANAFNSSNGASKAAENSDDAVVTALT
jgi:hypothetical protein